MPVEFSGQIYLNEGNEFNGGRGGGIDRDYFRRYARTLEDSGFDYTLVPYQSANHDPFTLAAAITQHTDRLKPIVAVRANTLPPTTAARQLATIDQLSDGRVAAHLIAGGNDHEQARERPSHQGTALRAGSRVHRADPEDLGQPPTVRPRGHLLQL
jgi:alkanesulfonate monooxygenase